METATRAARRVERVSLWTIAAGAALVAIVQVTQLCVRVAGLVAGPVDLYDVPLGGPQPAGFADATFDAVSVGVDLSAGGRAALIGAALTSSLLVLGICVALVVLCLRVLRGRPFTTSVTWGIGAVSVLVLLSGVGGPVLVGIANAEAALALDAPEIPPFLVQLDLGPIAWAFALAVVGAAFELGQRLQRDTDGLV